MDASSVLAVGATAALVSALLWWADGAAGRWSETIAPWYSEEFGPWEAVATGDR